MSASTDEARSFAPSIAIKPARMKMVVWAKKDGLRAMVATNVEIDDAVVALQHALHPVQAMLTGGVHQAGRLAPAIGEGAVAEPGDEEPGESEPVERCERDQGVRVLRCSPCVSHHLTLPIASRWAPSLSPASRRRGRDGALQFPLRPIGAERVRVRWGCAVLNDRAQTTSNYPRRPWRRWRPVATSHR